ncbi:hypothetical protein PAMP_002707 [Pampus punctatissimus]
MMGPQLLFVCWCSSILAVACCIRVDGYSCTSDYWDTVTCILNITGNPVGQSNTTYYLQFTPNSRPCENCLAMKHGYSCVCKPTDTCFISEDAFSIDVCHESNCKNLNSDFLPSLNIQLTPPHKPDVQKTPEAFNITWKSGYEDHDFLDHNLDYELFIQISQSNKGNEWLSPQGKFVLTYKTEEIISTDAIIVAPKPVSKAPEENQDFHNPPVTQLAFTQCQTSYVGLPGMHEASPPLPVICPGNTSYTQLPCSMWGFGIGEVEACVSSPPQNFLDISHADSGCSCDGLTQSLECSLPDSPVDYSPPPSNDYCVLNKTAEGVIPVLISK